jgi:hypothetical protein
VFSYLIDIQVVFHPALALANRLLLKHVIYSFEDMADEEKCRHFNTVYSYIWRTITRLVYQVAFQMHST